MFFNYVSNPSKALAGGDGVVTPNAAGEPGGVQVRGRYRMNCGQKKHPLRGGGAFFVFLFKFTNLKKKTKKARAPQDYFFRAGGRRGGLPPRRWWRPFVFLWACFLCFVRFLLRFAARQNLETTAGQICVPSFCAFSCSVGVLENHYRKTSERQLDPRTAG